MMTKGEGENWKVPMGCEKQTAGTVMSQTVGTISGYAWRHPERSFCGSDILERIQKVEPCSLDRGNWTEPDRGNKGRIWVRNRVPLTALIVHQCSAGTLNLHFSVIFGPFCMVYSGRYMLLSCHVLWHILILSHDLCQPSAASHTINMKHFPAPSNVFDLYWCFSQFCHSTIILNTLKHLHNTSLLFWTLSIGSITWFWSYLSI